jgi:tRNA A37 N6-isopentenylltransferase MiaA
LDELAEDESRYFHVGSWDTLHEVLAKLDKHAVMKMPSPENQRIVRREAFLGRYLRR